MRIFLILLTLLCGVNAHAYEGRARVEGISGKSNLTIRNPNLLRAPYCNRSPHSALVRNVEIEVWRGQLDRA